MTIDLGALKALMAQAGEWPPLATEGGDGDGYLRCPACDGEGAIDAECMKTLHAGLVGVQVYGIGDQMAAMEKLMPLLIRAGPALVEIAEAAKEANALDNLPVRTNPKYAAFYTASARMSRALKEIV